MEDGYNIARLIAWGTLIIMLTIIMFVMNIFIKDLLISGLISAYILFCIIINKWKT